MSVIVPCFIPLDLPSEYGLESLPGDLEHWFEAGDPFRTLLSVLMGPTGDDWTATVLYGGLPVLTVSAGATFDASRQYEWQVPEYVEPRYQSIQALFLENVVGELLPEGHENIGDPGVHPFPHALSVQVHEDSRENLYWMMGEVAGEGHELIAFVGHVAWAMHAAAQGNPFADPSLPEPAGF